MKAVVITTKDNKELKFIHDLLLKLGIASATMSEEDVEDFGLTKLMKDADRSKKVSRAAIMKKLGVK